MSYLQKIDPIFNKKNSQEEILRKLLKNKNISEIIDSPNKVDIAMIEAWAQRIKYNFSKVLVIGIGGSSLGAKALTDIRLLENKQKKNEIEIVYIDNIDPHSIINTINNIEFRDTAFLIISKSGQTIETLAQAHFCLEAFSRQFGDQHIADHFFILTSRDGNSLEKLALKLKIPIINWQKGIGGRFSAFTPTCLLPAALAGHDIREICAGATLAYKNPEKAIEGAMFHYSLMQQGYDITVMMPYIDRLSTLMDWFKQLWAESLGKAGHGSLPVKSIGTIDQHSQLQLYLDGKKDKVFNIVTLAKQDNTSEIYGRFADKHTSYLKNKSLETIMAISQAATVDSLKEKGCPVRELILEDLGEETIGELMMHLILETLMVACLLEIDPLSQPEVELVKQKLYKLLGVD